MQEPYQMQEAHDRINDRSEDSRPHCAICGGVIWEDKAISFNDRWFCWECETEAYADTPVKKSKEDYTRAQWQIDAHAYWRSSGDCLISKEDLQNASVDTLQILITEISCDI